jgi:hypothetical protein
MLTVHRTRPPHAIIEARGSGAHAHAQGEPIRKRRLVNTKPGH